jgi:hypothetical protein
MSGFEPKTPTEAAFTERHFRIFSHPTPVPEMCPRCGAPEFVPLIYGYPSSEGREAILAGEAAPGPCAIPNEAPVRECLRCGGFWPGDRVSPLPEAEPAATARGQELARRAPRPGDGRVERAWSRNGGWLLIFDVRFPWGPVTVYKSQNGVLRGGAPRYVVDLPFETARLEDAERDRIRALAIAAAVRYEAAQA